MFNAAGGSVTFKAASKTKAPAVSIFSTNQANGGGGGSGVNRATPTRGRGGNERHGWIRRPGRVCPRRHRRQRRSRQRGCGRRLVQRRRRFLHRRDRELLFQPGHRRLSAAMAPAAGSPWREAGETSHPAESTPQRVEQVVTPSAAMAATAAKAASELEAASSSRATGTLTLKPRLGAKSGSTQASATDVITANQANAGSAGTCGPGGQRHGRARRHPVRRRWPRDAGKQRLGRPLSASGLAAASPSSAPPSSTTRRSPATTRRPATPTWTGRSRRERDRPHPRSAGFGAARASEPSRNQPASRPTGADVWPSGNRCQWEPVSVQVPRWSKR